MTITFEKDYAVTTRINGQEIVYHPAKMDQSWIERFIEKGIQRYANDMYSGEKGQTKFDLCHAIAHEANSGRPAPEKSMRKASLPDDVQIAVKSAKSDLLLTFKKLTGAGKIADMQGEAKVAAFFNDTANGPVWNDETVLVWIGKQAEAGKRDYLAEAKASLELVSDIDLDI